jgi:type VI secretion system protein ImpG
VGRVPGATAASFCRGVEVTLRFDEDRFTGSGIYLLASVLERFLALYSSINSFTQTVVTSQQRPEIVRRWAPRAGQQVLA